MSNVKEDEWLDEFEEEETGQDDEGYYEEDDEEDDERQEHPSQNQTQNQTNLETQDEKPQTNNNSRNTDIRLLVTKLSTPSETLNDVAERLLIYKAIKKYDSNDLRHEIFEEKMGEMFKASETHYEDVILETTKGQTKYNSLIKELYPALSGVEFLKEENENSKALVLLYNRVIENLSIIDELSNIQFEDEVKEKEVEEVKEEKPVSEFDDDMDDVLEKPEVISNISRVMKVYKDLFEVGFELKKPFGVLTRLGYLKDRYKDNKHIIANKRESELEILFSMIESSTSREITQSRIMNAKPVSELRNFSIRETDVYYPEFQLANVMGFIGSKTMKSWVEFSEPILKFVQTTIAENFKKGIKLEHIVDALTTVIVISEFNPNSHISLRINVGKNQFDKNTFQRIYEAGKNKFMSGLGDLYQITQTDMGVVEITIVFDMATYNGRPLFAYEAVLSQQERGIKPSIKNMILGQDVSGRILSTNLDVQQACLLLIGAGQRSGKGVLTLNLLGTFYSYGSPVIYFDGKPDMANVLWSLSKKHGIRSATYDVFDSNGNEVGRGAPDKVKEDASDVFGLLSYLKMVQLMLVAARLQAKGINFYNSPRPLFVFDEALAVQMSLSGQWGKIVAIVKDKEEGDNDLKEWAKSLCEWIGVLDSDIPAAINSQIPASGISTAWLFQVMQPTTWNAYKIPNTTGNLPMFTNFITSRLSIKFLGRGTSDSEYALGGQKVKADPTVSKRVQQDGGRHFAMTGEQKITDPKSLKIFKPYLVLNSSDPDSKSATELLGNLTDDVKASVAPNGRLDPRTGFEQFAEMLGDDAIKNMQEGVFYLEALLKKIGILEQYGTIDNYIYSASKDDFYSTGTLVRMAEGISEEGSGDIVTATMDDGYDNEIESEDGLKQDLDDYQLEEDNQNSPDGIYTPNLNVVPNLNSEAPLTQGMLTGHDVPIAQPQSQHFENHQQEVLNPLPQEPVMYNEEQLRENPNNLDNNPNVYRNTMSIPVNPFKETRSKGVLSTFNAINIMSKHLLDEIAKMVGSLDRVHSIHFDNSGIVVNDISFSPKFEPEFMETLPFEIKNQVERGNLVELFNFKDLRRFKNLERLSIESLRLAEGRVRRELPLSPNKQWHTVFPRFAYLREIYIAGELITDEVTSNDYENSGKAEYQRQNEIRENLGVADSPKFENSHMNKMWKSRPVKIATGALGWTLGVKGVMVASAIFGGWGILFGAFAGYGAYRTYKKNRDV